MQPLDCWDCGLESRSGHGCPCFMFCLLCVSVCDLETSKMSFPKPELGCCDKQKLNYGGYKQKAKTHQQLSHGPQFICLTNSTLSCELTN